MRHWCKKGGDIAVLCSLCWKWCSNTTYIHLAVDTGSNNLSLSIFWVMSRLWMKLRKLPQLSKGFYPTLKYYRLCTCRYTYTVIVSMVFLTLNVEARCLGQTECLVSSQCKKSTDITCKPCMQEYFDSKWTKSVLALYINHVNQWLYNAFLSNNQTFPYFY
jgi:hypothetical protein